MSTDEAEALRALSDAHATALWRYIVRLTGDPAGADDIVQETLLRAWRTPAIISQEPESTRSWLFTVAANDCRSRMRVRFRLISWTAADDTRTVLPQEDGPPGVCRALHALRCLSPRDRLLLSLRAQGLAYREIGAAAGIREPRFARSSV